MTSFEQPNQCPAPLERRTAFVLPVHLKRDHPPSNRPLHPRVNPYLRPLQYRPRLLLHRYGISLVSVSFSTVVSQPRECVIEKPGTGDSYYLLSPFETLPSPADSPRPEVAQDSTTLCWRCSGQFLRDHLDG
jgi:hypothetical protein